MTAWLELASGLVWLVAGLVQIGVFKYELRLLREMREERSSREDKVA